MGLRRGREGRQNWRYSVLPHNWDADVNKYCIPSCSSCPSASPFWFFLSDFRFQKPWCSACMARKCSELDWKRSLWCPWCITHGSAGRGGTEWFHSLSEDKSHMNYGSLWGNYPRKHDIFSSESPKLMLVLWPLSWRRRKLPQEENVIGRRSISIVALGRGCRYGTERLRIVQTGQIWTVQEEIAFSNGVLSL